MESNALKDDKKIRRDRMEDFTPEEQLILKERMDTGMEYDPALASCYDYADFTLEDVLEDALINMQLEKENREAETNK